MSSLPMSTVSPHDPHLPSTGEIARGALCVRGDASNDAALSSPPTRIPPLSTLHVSSRSRLPAWPVVLARPLAVRAVPARAYGTSAPSSCQLGEAACSQRSRCAGTPYHPQQNTPALGPGCVALQPLLPGGRTRAPGERAHGSRRQAPYDRTRSARQATLHDSGRAAPTCTWASLCLRRGRSCPPFPRPSCLVCREGYTRLVAQPGGFARGGELCRRV